ncbi:MAG: LytTR family transcriptional regulator DNA-binding domain-containing protein [Wujia sp.]
MLRVGICDEITQDREQVRKIVLSTLFRYDEVTCVEYADAETLEQEIKNTHMTLDLLIMEIRYKDKNGLELATMIRDAKLDMDIIFVTNEKKYVYEGYRVQAQGYVLKEQLEQELPDCLERYIDNYINEGMITVKSDSVAKTISLASVQYVESDARMLILHTKAETIRFYGKLADVEKELRQYGFLRIHQSFLVKKSEIREVGGYEVLVGDTRLPVSRRYYRDVQEMFKPMKQREKAIDIGDNTITKSLAMRMEDNGAIIGTKGELLGIIYRMKKGEQLRLGRDAGECQLVLKNPNVSRTHCIVTRLKNGNYEIEDCSKNGVYIEGSFIGKGCKKEGHAGERVWICDEAMEFRLG